MSEPMHRTTKTSLATGIRTLQHEFRMLLAMHSKVAHHRVADIAQLPSEKQASLRPASLGVFYQVFQIGSVVRSDELAAEEIARMNVLAVSEHGSL